MQTQLPVRVLGVYSTWYYVRNKRHKRQYSPQQAHYLVERLRAINSPKITPVLARQSMYVRSAFKCLFIIAIASYFSDDKAQHIESPPVRILGVRSSWQYVCNTREKRQYFRQRNHLIAEHLRSLHTSRQTTPRQASSKRRSPASEQPQQQSQRRRPRPQNIPRSAVVDRFAGSQPLKSVYSGEVSAPSSQFLQDGNSQSFHSLFSQLQSQCKQFEVHTRRARKTLVSTCQVLPSQARATAN